MTIYDPAAMRRPLNIPEAIAREEGWNLTPPARCRRNCNPGNLNFEPWELPFGAHLESGPNARFAAFPDAPSGFSALVHLCGFPKYKGGTLANLIAAWAPPSDNNNTQAYLNNICRWTGLPPSTIIDAHLGL